MCSSDDRRSTGIQFTHCRPDPRFPRICEEKSEGKHLQEEAIIRLMQLSQAPIDPNFAPHDTHISFYLCLPFNLEVKTE